MGLWVTRPRVRDHPMPTHEPVSFAFFISSTLALSYLSVIAGWNPLGPDGRSIGTLAVAAPENGSVWKPMMPPGPEMAGVAPPPIMLKWVVVAVTVRVSRST